MSLEFFELSWTREPSNSILYQNYLLGRVLMQNPPLPTGMLGIGGWRSNN
ncbi:hypothetical protein AVDCRST_MAG84-1794 [uncultured Microcoleus sp.]|uniref:Uncharacterized protein n=1 Tax=uncultured Microcoleus sp. TaxID=259945 RepID=A0A6J4LD60_9CYAN|nr:hypothetical protein AVDCRST_MAG84-1794 [uncultured Microcoleus sp.]